MYILVKFHWDCGRNGELDGMFVTTQEKLDSNIGKRVEFGEVLGKHSDISGTIDKEDFEIVSSDQDFINKLIDVIGSHVSGYNPFSYLVND